MPEIQTSRGGIDYLPKVLRDRPTVITKAFFWKILRSSGVPDIELKLGRYKKIRGPLRIAFEMVETNEPKSELTLDNEEFLNLAEFIQENYEPFKKGVKQYIPIEGNFDQDDINHLKALFENPGKQQLIDFIVSNQIIP
jgi:hypothetical protein